MENRKETVKPFSRGEHRVRGSRSSRLRRGRYRRGVRAHECFDNHDQRDHHDLHTEESTLRENSRPRGDCLSNKRTFSEENTRLQSGSFGGHRQHIRPLRSQEGSPVRGGSPQRRGSHRRGGGPQIDSPWRGGGPQRRGSPRGGGPQIDSPRRGDGPQRGNGPQIRLRVSPRKGGNPRIRGSPQRGGGRQIRDRPQRGGSPREGHFQYWRDYSPGLYHDNESHYSVDLSPSPQFDHQPFRRPADDHPEPYRHSDLSPRPLHDQFQPLRRLDLSPSPARDCPESYHPRDLSPDPGNHIHLRYENISPTQDHDYYEVHHHNRHQNCSPRPSHGRTEHFQHSGILHFHEHHELPHPQNFEPQDRFRHHPRDFWDHPPDDFHEPPHPRNFPPGQSYDHDEATHQVHCSPPPHDHHGPPHREHPLKSRDWSPVKVPPDQRPMSKNTPQHGTFSRKGHQNFKFYHDGERWQRSQGRGRPHRRSQCSPRRGFGPRNRRQKASSGTRSSRPQDRTRSSSPRDRTCFSSPGDRTRLSPTRGRTRLSPKRDRTNSSQPRNRTCSSPPRGRPHFSPARDQTCFSPPHDRPHSSPARDRILSSPTRDRTNSSLSQNKTDSSQARDKNYFPPQNRAQSSPTGDRTLSLPTRDRAHSSPTRSRTLSSPTRDRAHSSPTRDRKKFSPPRGRTCSSSSISRACLPPPSAKSNTNSSSPPREILPSTSWHKRRVVLKGRRGGSSSQRNMSQSHASSIPHSGRERPKNEKSSHTTETSESRKPDQRRKSPREPVSENQKTLRGKTSMDKLDDPQQKAGSTRKQSPESVTVLGDSTRSSITSASVSKDSGVCPSNEMNSTEAVSSVHLDSTESEVHNAFDNSATLAKYTTDADLQTSETVDTNPVCELMKVCAISEAVAPANTRSLLPHQQPENVEIADILEEQPQRLEINKLSDLTAPSPKFIVSEAMPDVPEALPPHLEGKTAQRTADGAEPAEKNSSNVYSQSGASPTMDLSAAETAEEESQTLTEPMYQPEVFPVSEDDSEDDFPLPRLHTREATHSPYRPVLSPVSDASIDDPSQPEALDMSTTENIHSKPPTLSSQPVFPLFSETWSSSNVFMSHAAEEGPQTNVESACRYQPGVSPVSDSDDNDDQIHLSVPRMQGVTISPYRPVLSPVSDASDDGAVDVLVSAGIDQPQHQSYNTVQVKTPSTGAQDKLQSQVERLASPPNRHSRSSRDVQSGQNPEEGKDEVGADRPADAEECQSPRSDGTTDNCSSGDAIILDLSDTDIPLPGPEGDAGEDHPHEGTCQDRPKSGSTNNDISLAQAQGETREESSTRMPVPVGTDNQMGHTRMDSSSSRSDGESDRRLHLSGDESSDDLDEAPAFLGSRRAHSSRPLVSSLSDSDTSSPEKTAEEGRGSADPVFRADPSGSQAGSSSQQPSAFSLDSLLRDKKETDALEEEMKVMQAELRAGILKGGIEALEKEENSDDEDENFTTEQRDVLSRLQMEDRQIADCHPGEQVLQAEQCGRLFTESISPAQCGFKNSRGSSLERLLDRLQPEFVTDILSSDIIPMTIRSLPSQEQVLCWLFLLASVHSDGLVVLKCGDQIQEVLQWQLEEVMGGGPVHHTWAPSIKDVFRLFVNWGAVPEDLLFDETVLGPKQIREVLPVPAEDVPPLQQPLKIYKRNVQSVLQILSACLQSRPAYSIQELTHLLLMVCRVALDSSLCDQSSLYELQVCTSSVLECYSASQWHSSVPPLCCRLSTLTDHHHNQVHLTQLFPAASKRSLYLRQRLAYVMLFNALPRRLGDGSITDEGITNFQLKDVVCLVPRMRMFLETDLYRLSSLVYLLDTCVGSAFMLFTQQKQLYELIEAVRYMVSDMRDNVRRLDLIRVKDVLVRMCSKWDLALKSSNIRQRKIFACYSSQDSPAKMETLHASSQDDYSDDDDADVSSCSADEEDEETMEVESGEQSMPGTAGVHAWLKTGPPPDSAVLTRDGGDSATQVLRDDDYGHRVKRVKPDVEQSQRDHASSDEDSLPELYPTL